MKLLDGEQSLAVLEVMERVEDGRINGRFKYHLKRTHEQPLQ
jgi:hypothetical protein